MKQKHENMCNTLVEKILLFFSEKNIYFFTAQDNACWGCRNNYFITKEIILTSSFWRYLKASWWRALAWPDCNAATILVFS